MDWDNQQQVIKALLFLYSRQTLEEKMGEMTVEDNAQGFNAVDAPFCTSVAKQILNKRGISQKQYSLILGMLRKYSGQLSEMIVDDIELPVTAVVYDKGREKRYDGKLKIEDNELIFTPFIFPSSQARDLGFVWKELDPSSGKRAWVAEPTSRRINAIRDVFDLLIESSVDDWVSEQLEDKVVEISDERVMYFQKQIIGFALDTERTMIGAAPGLGKSLIGIFAAKIAGGKTLIVCPTSLMRNWVIEIKKWYPEARAEIWHQRLGYSDDVEFVIVNYETVRNIWVDWDEKVYKKKSGKKAVKRVNWRCIVEHDFDNLICDESAMIKNRNAQRSNAVKALAKDFKKVWFLSGFPAKRYFDDLWMQFHILYPKRYTSYWRFAREYCFVEQNIWGGWVIKANQPDAADRIKADTADFYISRTQEQVIDIPPWLFDDYNIDMYPDQYRLYCEMEEKFLAILPEGDVVLAPIVLTQLLRLIQFASNPMLLGSADNSAKWDAVTEILEFERLPAIIWTAFIETANVMTKRLTKAKLRVASLTGQTKHGNRQTIVNDFQAGKYDVIVAHPGVGKYGFTMTAGKTAIYLERTYDGDNYYQSLYRIRRIGTTEAPHVIHLLSSRPDESNAPTVDHVIHKVLERRKEDGLQLTSGEIRDAFTFGA